MHRATGVIYTSDVPEQRVVLQVVGRRVDFSTQGGWDQRVPRTPPRSWPSAQPAASICT